MCLPSDPPVLLRSYSPLFLHDSDPPAKNPTSIITDKNQRTAICVTAHLISVSALSFNQPVNKAHFVLTYLLSLACVVTEDRTQNIYLHGSPAPSTHRCPRGTRQHPPDFTLTNNLSSCCLWKSHGLACFLCG